ncbi:MAG: biotin--[acetyl-CoA-carboxylase] ligase [Pseudomonadota bacterium]
MVVPPAVIPDVPSADEHLSVASLAARLDTSWLGRRRHLHVPACTSTNDIAAAEARAGAAEGLLVTADEQTAGRGRLGRTWHSPPGTNLMLSLLLRPKRPAAEIPTLTLLAGGALSAAIRALGFETRVKWPNDLLLRAGGREKKVAGILTEASSEGGRIGHVVVGIGLNVNTEGFPDELSSKATSLRIARGAALSRVEVLARMLGALEAAFDDFAARGPAAAVEWWEAHAELGRAGRVQMQAGDRTIEGLVTGLGVDGALEVRDDAGTLHRIVSGEVLSVEC